MASLAKIFQPSGSSAVLCSLLDPTTAQKLLLTGDRTVTSSMLAQEARTRQWEEKREEIHFTRRFRGMARQLTLRGFPCRCGHDSLATEQELIQQKKFGGEFGRQSANWKNPKMAYFICGCLRLVWGARYY